MDSHHRLAYRMLGSVEEAEDVVQEARLKWHAHVDQSQVEAEDAYLFRMVANLSVDRLRRLKRERRLYPGPWLPDPVLLEQTDDGPDTTLAQAEDLSMGMMLMLERLSPAERITFTLREAFDYSHEEIARLLGISASAARQRSSRARQRMRQSPPPPRLPDAACREQLQALLACVVQGDAEGLIAMLSEDAVALTDGGGLVSAAIIPIVERQRIATVTLHLGKKLWAEASDLKIHIEPMNGTLGLVLCDAGEIHSVILIAGTPGALTELYVMRNPNKLRHLSKRFC